MSVSPPVAAVVACLAGCVIAPGSALAQSQNPFNYSRASHFQYFPAGTAWYGLVQSETIEPTSAALCLTTTYTYDGYGNRASATTANCTTAGTVPAQAQITSRTSNVYYNANASPSVTLPSVTVGTTVLTQVAGAYPIASANALSQMQTRSFDPRFGIPLSEKDPNGLAVQWSVDDFGRKVLEVRPDGTSTVTQYCYTRGTSTSSNSAGCPSPQAAEIPTDAQMFVHSEPHDKNNMKMGAYVRIYYDRLGRQIRQATESFDASSQPAATGGVIVQDTQYNQFGAKQIETQPYFLATTSSTTTGSADAGLRWTQYDAFGRTATVYVTDPNGNAGSVAFPASYAFPSGVSQVATHTSYSYSGLSVTIVNDKGQPHTEEQDPFGRGVRETDATGATLIKYYDAFGNLVQTTDALGNSIVVTYDIRGNKLSMQDPDLGLWQYTYDALSETVWQQNPNERAATAPAAKQTTMSYDVLGRMAQRVEPEYVTSWFYDKYANGSTCPDGIGKLCEVTTTSGMDRKVVYDTIGRPTDTLQVVSGAPSLAAAVSYDSVTGRPASRTYPTGLIVNTNYTPKGFIQSLTLPSTGMTVNVNPLPAVPGGAPGNPTTLPPGYALWTANAVDAWGNVEQQTFGNNVVGRAVFDRWGRPLILSAGVGGAASIANESYVWDSIGNLRARTDYNGDGSTGSVTEGFTYDALNRLNSYTVAGGGGAVNRQETIQYNALGDVLYRSDVGVYTYSAACGSNACPHAVSQLAGGTTISYRYDAQGNLTSATGGAYKSITYTSFNLPDSQTGVQGSVNTSYTWQYDEVHARIRQTRISTVATTVTASGPSGYTAGGGQVAAGTRVTWYLHADNVGGLGYEYECETSACASGTSVSRHYLTAGGMAIGILQSVGTTITPAGTAPPTISTITLNKIEYWHRDHLGSLIATTDHTGAVTARYSHDPFGKHRYANGAYDLNGVLVADYTTTTNSGTARGFTGHEELDDVELINMNGRFYDPVLGRFVQADPFTQSISNLQSFNRYSYASNNPVRFADPSGFLGEEIPTITITDSLETGDPYVIAGAVIVDVAISLGDAIVCFFTGCDTATQVQLRVVNGPVTPTAISGPNTQLIQPTQTSSNTSAFGNNVSSTAIGGNDAPAMGTGFSSPSAEATSYVEPLSADMPTPEYPQVVIKAPPPFDAGPVASVVGPAASAAANSSQPSEGRQPKPQGNQVKPGCGGTNASSALSRILVGPDFISIGIPTPIPFVGVVGTIDRFNNTYLGVGVGAGYPNVGAQIGYVRQLNGTDLPATYMPSASELEDFNSGLGLTIGAGPGIAAGGFSTAAENSAAAVVTTPSLGASYSWSLGTGMCK